jgi:hypothetical protein
MHLKQPSNWHSGNWCHSAYATPSNRNTHQRAMLEAGIHPYWHSMHILVYFLNQEEMVSMEGNTHNMCMPMLFTTCSGILTMCKIGRMAAISGENRTACTHTHSSHGLGWRPAVETAPQHSTKQNAACHQTGALPQPTEAASRAHCTPPTR